MKPVRRLPVGRWTRYRASLLPKGRGIDDHSGALQSDERNKPGCLYGSGVSGLLPACRRGAWDLPCGMASQ